MCLMESFARPPRSVPSDDLTIQSASSGVQSADPFEGMDHRTNSVVNINLVPPRTRDVQTSLAINSPCASRMVKGNRSENGANLRLIVDRDVSSSTTADQCKVSPVAVTRARAARSARTLRMMNRRQPAHANGSCFRCTRRLFFCVAAVLMRVLRVLSRWFKCDSLPIGPQPQFANDSAR